MQNIYSISCTAYFFIGKNLKILNCYFLSLNKELFPDITNINKTNAEMFINAIEKVKGK